MHARIMRVIRFMTASSNQRFHSTSVMHTGQSGVATGAGECAVPIQADTISGIKLARLAIVRADTGEPMWLPDAKRRRPLTAPSMTGTRQRFAKASAIGDMQVQPSTMESGRCRAISSSQAVPSASMMSCSCRAMRAMTLVSPASRDSSSSAEKCRIARQRGTISSDRRRSSYRKPIDFGQTVKMQNRPSPVTLASRNAASPAPMMGASTADLAASMP